MDQRKDYVLLQAEVALYRVFLWISSLYFITCCVFVVYLTIM